MSKSSTPFSQLFTTLLKSCCFYILYVAVIGFCTTYGQPCTPISTLPCNQIQAALPFSLNFNSSVAGSITDKNGAGTGFTMVASYSGTRLTQDGTPSNANVPGYEASKLAIAGGSLQIVTNKGIAYLTNNNQINALGVKIDSRGKIQMQTTLINPYNGSSSQQAGLWFGLHDKTFIKLAVSANKIELRKENNDVSSTASGTGNPDQRITGSITSLNTKTVRLRLIIDPTNNTAEGFYSTDGTTYTNVGATYATRTLSIAGMGLTSGTAYAGIYATHRNATTSVTYNFDEFGILTLNNNTAPVFSPDTYTFSLPDNADPGTAAGSVHATDANGDALNYTIVSGNTNKAFAINASTGAITIAKILNHHTQDKYSLTVSATDGGGLSDNASINITVTEGITVPAFTTISWGTAASQPVTVTEGQGEVVNGKLYTFGGFDSQKSGFTPTNRAYVFNPVANTWTPIASMPPMNGTSHGGVTHAGFTTDGTDIYFAGGYTANATGTGQIFGTKEAWRYIVAENRYVRLPDLPISIAAGQLEYLKGKLHHIAGTNASRTQDLGNHYVLDLDNLAAGWKTLAPLPIPRQHAGSTVFEGKIYFIGGQIGHDDNLVTKKDVHRYDPLTDSWTKLADLPVPGGANGRGHISSAVINIGKRIIAAGGEIVHGTSINMVSAYTPENNTWTNLTPLPANRYSGVTANLGNIIYYTGGSNSKITYKGTPGGTTIQQVINLSLINADTEQPISFLSTTGTTLNLGTLPTRNLNIRAITNPATVGSVVFNLTGAQNKNVTEGRAPYALFGDNTAGDYYAWTPSPGTYILKATPYAASGGTGTAGTPLTVTFTVVDQPAITGTEPVINVYPNPGTGEDMRVEVHRMGQQKQLNFWLIDIFGHVVERKVLTTDNEGKASTPLSTSKKLQKGMYILQIQTPGGKVQRRLMVR